MNKKNSLLLAGLILPNTGCTSHDMDAKQLPLIPLAILFGNPEKCHVRISPDGQQLAYLAPYEGALNIWIKTVGKQDDHVITTATGHGIQAFCWAKNNRDILWLRDNNGDENWHVLKTDLATLETVDLTPFPGVKVHIHSMSKHFPNDALITMNKENPKLFDVYRLDIPSGALTLVAKNPGHVRGWLEDANLCVRAAIGATPDGGHVLLVRNVTDGEWATKASWGAEDSHSGPLRFSHDGKFLYLKDSAGANTLRLVKMDLATGARETVASDDACDLGTAMFNLDTCEPEVVTFTRARRDWVVLCPELVDDFKAITAANKGDLTYIDRSTDDMRWVLGFAPDDGPSAYYLYHRQTKKIEFLFYGQAAITAYKLAPMEPITFASRDGLTIHGYLTCPLGQQRANLPMVLLVHGGPQHRDTWGCNGIVQWLANRGYACLQVNFRGSTGYGKNFVNAGDREWGGKMHDDLIDAVNWAIEQGIADPKKIAIFGASYGGYAALVGATFTPDVFCCAVDLCGISNLTTFLNSMPPYWEAMRAEIYKRIGNPVTDVEFLHSRSPLFRVDQIKIPIFIAQGANDPRVKQAEAEQIVAAMQEKGLTYEYLLFPDEGHGIARPENSIKCYTAVEKFLTTYLGGRHEESVQE